MRRLIDAAVSLLATLTLLPALLMLARMRGRRVRHVTVYGRLGAPVRYPVLRLFARSSPGWPLNYAGALLAVLLGRLSLTGPRVALARGARPAYTRFAARPGLISPYLLQQRANIAHDGRERSDVAFLRAATLRSHASLFLRFGLSLLIGAPVRHTPDRLRLLDVDIANHTMASAVAAVRSMARSGTFGQITFVNADCYNLAADNPAYRRLLGSVAMVLADGIGVRQAARWFLGCGLKDNVNGTDLFPRLCRMAADEGLRLYLLGAGPGVAAAVAQNARKRVPNLAIAGHRDGFWRADEEQDVVAEIRASRADILLVALGAPRQDLWIARHGAALGVKVAMGVGGQFDFYAGRIARAPLWMRELGLEWTYRLLQEPRRMWRRYVIGNPRFLWRAWRWARGARAAQSRNAAASERSPA